MKNKRPGQHEEFQYMTDWLGTNVIFYNEKTNATSSNINDVIDPKYFDFHLEGLKNYLDYGYSVFGQTPIRYVKFLSANQRLTIKNNQSKVEDLPDPVEKYLDKKTNEEEVIEMIKSKIHAWESKIVGDIIIPTSGGFDSRLLNLLVNDKSRIRSFTYGLADKQRSSSEVIRAERLSKILNTKWRQVELGDFHEYLDDWDKLFGISTHAHGMYQIEFYKKISKIIKKDKFLLSGIIGDAWSGNVTIGSVLNRQNVKKLGYTHGLGAESSHILMSPSDNLTREYFKKKEDALRDERMRLVESMRTKMILLKYLFEVPESMGYSTFSPFLDIEVVMAILNLPNERRKNRQWQKDYFKKNDVDFESQDIKADFSNTLDLQAIIRKPLPNLNVSILSQVLDKKYIESINKTIGNAPRSLSVRRVIANFLRTTRLGNIFNPDRLNIYNLNCAEAKAYYAYMTIKPIENLILRIQR